MDYDVTDGPSADLAADPASVRRRVTDALGEESFEAAVVRRTTGTPSYADVTEERYDSLDALPETPFDQSAMRTELVVFSATAVYRWIAAGGTVERTRLPRSPDAMDGST